MLLSYRYKLAPTKAQREKLDRTLYLCRTLYNCALEQRIRAYKKGVSISRYAQDKELPLLKTEIPEYKAVHSQVLQDVLKRLDKAYQSFFRRVKARNKSAGFPRFQGRGRYDSFVFPQYRQAPSGKHLYIPKIGNVRIRLSRDIKGKVKTLTIKRDSCGDWFAIFACEIEPKYLPKTGNEVGVDVGLTYVVVTSDGEKFEAPKYLRKMEARLRKAQRRFSRKKAKSNRREKARILVAKLHRKVKRQREHFLRDVANYLIRNNDTIIVEDLNLLGLNRGMLSKSFTDVAIGKAGLQSRIRW